MRFCDRLEEPMGRPKLTEFLLRLATDVEVFEKFKKGNNKQRADLMQVA